MGLAIGWLLFVPAADWLATHDVGHPSGSSGTLLVQTARDAARGRLLTYGAGLFAAGALIFTARNFTVSRRTLELTEQGQVTDRYTRAIEQLGSTELDVRIGGIYALERIARDSARDHPTVMEVLAAFIREHSREQWPLPDPDGHVPERQTRPDVQAAITVIGRRDAGRDRDPISLAGVNLTRANLSRANLNGANLVHADLTGVWLTDALLSGAVFGDADLTDAVLGGADLTGALLSANLTRANLTSADLTDAILIRADLTDAFLIGANLTRANLTRATMTRTKLVNANLAGAKLANVDLPQADIAGANFDDADLTNAWFPSDAPIPAGWTVPASGRLARVTRQ